MRAIRASLVGLFLVACSGGQTGQPTSGTCSDDSTPASETMERFAGSYESPVATPDNDAECPLAADALLHVEIESDFDERESLEQECGAAWLPVSVELTTDDGELETTEQGWLTTNESAVGLVHIDEPSFGGGELILMLEPEAHGVSSSRAFDDYRTFDACCLEAPPDESFSELLGLDALGLMEFLPGAPDVVGQDSVALELRITSEPPTNGCFGKGKLDQPASFELLDAEGTVVATGTGHAKGISCPALVGCIPIQVVASGQVSDASYLGAKEPLKGEASRIFLEATFISCETPALVELGMSIDVQLEEYAIEMGLTPAPSSGIAPPTEGPPEGCF